MKWFNSNKMHQMLTNMGGDGEWLQVVSPDEHICLSVSLIVCTYTTCRCTSRARAEEQ